MSAIPPSGSDPSQSGNIPPPGARPSGPSSSSEGGIPPGTEMFARMFEASGAKPTAKELKQMMDGLLKSVLASMKQDEAQAKQASEQLKRTILGEN